MSSHSIFEFLSAQTLNTEEDCKKIFNIINDIAPCFLPVKYDRYEPFKKTFNMDDLTEVLTDWATWDLFFWKGKKPVSQGSYISGVNSNYHIHDSFSMDSNLNDKVVSNFLELLFRFTQDFELTFAYIATPYPRDFDIREYYGHSIMPYTQGLSGHHLKKGLPDGLAWGMFFGKEYVELFGKDKLLTAPVFETRAHSDGVYVQLTENITDPLENYESYMELKKAFMDHVGADAFLSIDNPNPRLPDLSLR